jgi:hypothetical protein
MPPCVRPLAYRPAAMRHVSSSLHGFAVRVAVVAIVLATSSAHAQLRGRTPTTRSSRTGLELALSGPTQVVAGQTARLHGTAYEVRGLATLRALPGAEVRARYATDAADIAVSPFATVIAGADGRFALDVPIPARVGDASRLDVEVAHGEDVREFQTLLAVSPALVVDAFTDRRLYEPGETVRVWVRALDAVSRAPLAGVTVNFEVFGGLTAPTARTTAASGVTLAEIPIPESFAAGDGVVRVTLTRPGEPSAATALGFAVGRRVVERMRVDAEVAPDAPAPGAPITVTVTARTTSGAPLRAAHVAVTMADGAALVGTTSDDGVARITARAPAFLADATGRVGLVVHVTHAAQGTRTIETSFAMAQPRTLVLDATGPAGGLVPDVPQTLWITLLDAAGRPPDAAQTVRVTGAAVRGGSFTGTTDAHGIVAVPALLPAGAAAPHGGGTRCAGRVATSLDVTVEGEVPRVARLCVNVADEALVGVRAEQPTTTPGGTIAVTVARRPAVAERAVIVELRALRDDAPGVLASRLLAPNETRAVLTLPAGYLGPTLVRARPLDVAGAAEGAGGLDAILVRPARPVFATLALDRAAYPVRGEARLTVQTPPGGPRAWVAVLARDLAMHAGESPFRRTFLDAEFDRALLDPEARGAEDFLRVTLAAGLTPDPEPNRAEPLTDALGTALDEADASEPDTQRGDLRDPIAAADELARRGVAPLMRAAEEALAEALDGDAGDDDPLDTITEGRGRSRRFREELLADRLGDEAITLGDGVARTSMLEELDPSFSYESVARRVARRRLVTLLAALARYLEPDESGSDGPRAGPDEPADRWLSRMTQQGLIAPSALRDPWGGRFVLRRSVQPAMVVARAAAGWELVSPGPDGVAGNADDVRDPFARVVPAGTPWAIASGEDLLMAALGALAPGEATLRAIAAAYARLTDAAEEEARGDALIAGASEYGEADGAESMGLGGLGLRGSGRGGGGSGMGYGSGSGSLRGRSTRSPSVRSAQAQISGGGRGALSALLRRRFPATLALFGDVPVASDGRTTITVPLADAATTYVVEAVLWDEAGWTWSAFTELRVDRDVVVDAAIPPIAVVGDRLRVPARVGNRTAEALAARVSLTDDGHTDDATIDVPAGDARAVPLTLALTRAGTREVTAQIARDDGTALDAIARPITVLADARPVRAVSETLGRGRAVLSISVPAHATRLATSTLRIETGEAIFASSDGARSADAWMRTLLGRARDTRTDHAALALFRNVSEAPEQNRATITLLARSLGALWNATALADDDAREALTRLAMCIPQLNAPAEQAANDATQLAEVLLGLAPAVSVIGARPALRELLLRVVGDIRGRLATDAAMLSDAPAVHALAAAALFLAATDGDRDKARATELRRRARRAVLRLGDEAWLPPALDTDDTHGPRRASALLALAEAHGGDRNLAVALLRGLRNARERRDEPRRGADAPHDADDVLATLAAARLASDGRSGPAAPVTEATVRIAGRARRVPLRAGSATIDVPELGQPGAHRVEVEATPGTVLRVRTTLRYGVPWGSAPTSESGLALALEAMPAARETRGGFTLVVRNRAPRVIGTPLVDVLLPAGAELDAEALRALLPVLSTEPRIEGRTLLLRLRPLRPGGTARIPLALRFTVAGTLHGLGVVARALDAPGRVSVLPPRTLTLADGDAR